MHLTYNKCVKSNILRVGPIRELEYDAHCIYTVYISGENATVATIRTVVSKLVSDHEVSF